MRQKCHVLVWTALASIPAKQYQTEYQISDLLPLTFYATKGHSREAGPSKFRFAALGRVGTEP